MKTYMKNGSIFLTLLLVLGLGSCIDEYEHSGLEDISGLLVIEGTITNDSTKIRLSRSVKLSESAINAPVIDNAQVTIETEKGTVFQPARSVEDGTYFFLTGDLDFTDKYRTKVILNGETYVSAFKTPQKTPPVDFKFDKKEKGAPVKLLVSTQGSDDESRYYMWSYDEIWEYSSRLMANAYQYPETGIGKDVTVIESNPYSPYHYCWSFGKSNSILLGSSAKLSENKIDNFSLQEYPPSNLRFSLLHYVKLKQYCLSKEGYDYYYNLKQNTESSGGIFGPIPSEMKGNIQCLTDESMIVIGYIEVAENHINEQYFPRKNDLYEADYREKCDIYSITSLIEEEISFGEVTVVDYADEIDDRQYAYRSCVDCRTYGGYYNKKPSHWPNNHDDHFESNY